MPAKTNLTIINYVPTCLLKYTMWVFFICLLFCKHVDKYYLCIRNKNKGYETEDSPTGGEGAATKKKIIAMWEERRPQTPPNISDHKIMVGIADELRTCVQTVHKILMRNGKIQPKRTKPQV